MARHPLLAIKERFTRALASLGFELDRMVTGPFLAGERERGSSAKGMEDREGDSGQALRAG